MAAAQDQKRNEIYDRRQNLGYAIGVLAILIILGFGVSAVCFFKDLAHPAKDDWVGLHFTYALIAGHAVVALAMVWFCYQLIRLAERFLFPAWWAEKAEIARIMLHGVEHPAAMAKEWMSELIPTIVAAIRGVPPER